MKGASANEKQQQQQQKVENTVKKILTLDERSCVDLIPTKDLGALRAKLENLLYALNPRIHEEKVQSVSQDFFDTLRLYGLKEGNPHNKNKKSVLAWSGLAEAIESMISRIQMQTMISDPVEEEGKQGLVDFDVSFVLYRTAPEDDEPEANSDSDDDDDSNNSFEEVASDDDNSNNNDTNNNNNNNSENTSSENGGAGEAEIIRPLRNDLKEEEEKDEDETTFIRFVGTIDDSEEPPQQQQQDSGGNPKKRKKAAAGEPVCRLYIEIEGVPLVGSKKSIFSDLVHAAATSDPLSQNRFTDIHVFACMLSFCLFEMEHLPDPSNIFITDESGQTRPEAVFFASHAKEIVGLSNQIIKYADQLEPLDVEEGDDEGEDICVKSSSSKNKKQKK